MYIFLYTDLYLSLYIYSSICKGSTDALLALINRGADVTKVDRNGLTALHCAASRHFSIRLLYIDQPSDAFSVD